MEDFDEDGDDDYSETDETRYGTFYCATCGLSFHRQDNLRRHQRIHIKEEYLNEHDVGHICNVCGESFQVCCIILSLYFNCQDKDRYYISSRETY